jgi:hypothetical protein
VVFAVIIVDKYWNIDLKLILFMVQFIKYLMKDEFDNISAGKHGMTELLA